MTGELEPLDRSIPPRLKRSILIAGVLLILAGLPAALNMFCIVPFSLLSSAPDTPVYVMTSLMWFLMTMAAGGLILYHANQSLHQKPSRPLRLPSPSTLVTIFGVVLVLGIFVKAGGFPTGIFIPPLLSLAAALPPLWAITWMTGQKHGSVTGFTWRRGLVAFAGGASAGLFIALILETLLLATILTLGFDLFPAVTNNLEAFFYALGRERWAAVLPSQGFVYVFLYFTLIAPLVEELAKPMGTLPVLRYLNRQETFWTGAIAGAGLAVLENSLYATIGTGVWVGFLFIRAWGSAVQPFCSGLVTLGWRDILHKEPGAWGLWARRFGVAVAVHAAWNAGSLLVVILGAAFFSGNLPRETGLLAVAALGILFFALIFLGLLVLWMGRWLGQGQFSLLSTEASPRKVAIWALACLLFVLPAGLIFTRLWLR